MPNHGFVRVATATPQVKVADSKYNTEEIIKLIADAEKQQVAVIVFPELSITAYTCGDLFHQHVLLDAVYESVRQINKQLETKSIIAIVGMPLVVGDRLYNVAAVLSKGKVFGFVPKTYLPNYAEFYEKRWFSSSTELSVKTIKFLEQEVPIGTNLIFQIPSMRFGIEICEDLWAPIAPSTILALNGAEVIFNLSASNEVVGKHSYRKMLVKQQSARSIAGYVYAGAGTGESTTDLVFAGCSLIAENGQLLAEGERFSSKGQVLFADIDIERLKGDRIRNTSFANKLPFDVDGAYSVIDIATPVVALKRLNRFVSPTPFLPATDELIDESCSEIFSIQSSGLVKRLQHTNCEKAVIGISGGLDSTLALLVVVRAFDKLGLPRENIIGITMPGFGTTDRTYLNALALMKLLKITVKEIAIRDAVMQHFKDIEHDPNVHDVTYENSQARERTQILMDYANKVNGLVIGTGDLSELALGWCTYNGDHMSMYAVNAGVPKTLVKTLVSWVADGHTDASAKTLLDDIVDTPVSPELLPVSEDGTLAQITENVVGPYILHDFFLYYILRFGFSPSKIYFLAQYAFEGKYTNDEILKYLRLFLRRFFSQQFKRSCLPDGPKVGSVNLSPRGDWRMPSDASVELWLR